MKNNPIHTVIFDLDGTLSDTAILTMKVLGRFAPEYGLPVPSEEMIKDLMGYKTPEFIGHLFPDLTLDEAEKLGRIMDREELKELKNVDDILFDGVLELLKSLKDLGIRMHIASTGSTERVMTTLSVADIEEFFDTVVSGCSDKTEILCEMTKGGEKNGYIMVGDSIKDYTAARENGIVSVGVCLGYCSRETSKFDLYIDHPLELLNILRLEN